MEKILIGILLLLLTTKWDAIWNLILNQSGLDTSTLGIFAIPSWLRVIVGLFGLWFLFGRVVGYLFIIWGILIAAAVGPLTAGVGIIVGIGVVVVGILILKSTG